MKLKDVLHEREKENMKKLKYSKYFICLPFYFARAFYKSKIARVALSEMKEQYLS